MQVTLLIVPRMSVDVMLSRCMFEMSEQLQLPLE
jgi:hypothetical protein